MDRFESMSAFVAVAEAGGFSAASRALGMPLATISRKVAELEEALGAQLLVRSNKSVSLTDIGREYFESSRRLLEDLAEIERGASGAYSTPKGLLVVSAPVALGRLHLSPILIDFLRAYPEIDVELRLSDRYADLFEDRIDVALRVGELADSSMIAVRAGEVRRVVCASPAYLARKPEPSHPRDLAQHDCITMLPLENAKEWSFKIGKRFDKFSLHSRLVVTTAETAADAAVADLGVTRLFCYQVASAIMEKRLQLLLRKFEAEPVPVQFVYPGGRRIPQKLRALLDYVQPRLKSRLVFEA